MDHSRRSTLRLIGLAGAGLTLAGCLAGDDPENDDGDDSDGEFQHVDEPPYETTEPECPQSGGERDPLWLCANMAAEPSVQLEQVETNGSVLQDEGLQYDPDTTAMQFYATLLTGAEDLDRLDASRVDRRGDSRLWLLPSALWRHRRRHPADGRRPVPASGDAGGSDRLAHCGRNDACPLPEHGRGRHARGQFGMKERSTSGEDGRRELGRDLRATSGAGGDPTVPVQ
ncbi:MAG: hypothetical protein V5A25_12310 [Halovenus sp.]